MTASIVSLITRNSVVEVLTTHDVFGDKLHNDEPHIVSSRTHSGYIALKRLSYQDGPTYFVFPNQVINWNEDSSH